MSYDFFDINRINCNLPGLKSLHIFDPSNLNGRPMGQADEIDFLDDAKVYSISFERSQGSFEETAKRSEHGDYYEHVVKFFVPKRRIEMETLITLLRNRRVHAIAIDRNNTQSMIWRARFTYKFTTGSGTSANGYSCILSASSIRNAPSLAGNLTLPTTNNGEMCCITINPVQLAYVPPPTGNTENLNKMVTASNGATYFIDKDGLALSIGSPMPVRQPFTNVSATFVHVTAALLPDPTDTINNPPDFIAAKVWVKVDTTFLTYLEGFYIDYVNQRIYFVDQPEFSYVEIFIYP